MYHSDVCATPKRSSRRPHRFRGVSEKVSVLSLVHVDTREVRSQVVPDVTAASLLKAMQGQADLPNLRLHTDSALAYKSIAQHAPGHEYVNHDAGEYVGKGGASTNLVEGYFSQLKRSLDGTFRHVSPEHLHRYLAHFDFMYTHCKATDSERMRRLLDRVTGRRLTYLPLTGW